MVKTKQLINELSKSLRWQNFIFLFVAGCINAFGVNIFLAPVGLYDSGISGTSILLSQITPDYLSLSVFLLILNVPLFLFGLKKQGTAFTVYSLFAVAVYSAASWIIVDVLPVDVSFASPLAGEDLLLCALFGGVISGVGSGLTIRYGGAIDGVEVMAVIFAKKLSLTVGTFVMIYNVILYILCGSVMHSWILPLYSIVAYGAGLKTVDFVVEGIDRSKEVMIVTDKAEEISAALMEAFECGTTKIAARGGYSDADKTNPAPFSEPLPDLQNAGDHPLHRPESVRDHQRCGRYVQEQRLKFRQRCVTARRCFAIFLLLFSAKCATIASNIRAKTVMVWRKKNYYSGSLAIPASGRGRRSSLTACFPVRTYSASCPPAAEKACATSSRR